MIISVELAIARLNDMLAADKSAMSSLVTSRVRCNEELADHKTAQVHTCGDVHMVGLLGVINGIFGDESAPSGPIAAEVDESGNVLRFMRTP